MVFSLRSYNKLDATLAHYTTPLPFVDKIKYLGLVFNYKLLWKEHIDQLLASTGPFINLLRMLSSTHWGGDPTILSMFYKSIIRSKLDYGSTIFGSASNVQLNKLEVFQNKCLRLMTGALSSTPTPALCAETGISPLSFRRNYLTDRVVIRCMTSQSSSLPNSVQYILSHWRFAKHKLPLLCKRASLIFQLQPYIIRTPSYLSLIHISEPTRPY